jgi:hypothetical protein
MQNIDIWIPIDLRVNELSPQTRWLTAYARLKQGVTSVLRLQRVDVGYNPENLLTGNVQLVSSKYVQMLGGDMKRVPQAPVLSAVIGTLGVASRGPLGDGGGSG